MKSNVTLIPIKFCEKIRKPKLKKSNLQLKQFDGTLMDTFEWTFETKKGIRNYYYHGSSMQWKS